MEAQRIAAGRVRRAATLTRAKSESTCRSAESMLMLVLLMLVLELGLAPSGAPDWLLSRCHALYESRLRTSNRMPSAAKQRTMYGLTSSSSSPSADGNKPAVWAASMKK